MKLTRPERPGNVCVLMAFCITILVGVAAVAIDGGANGVGASTTPQHGIFIPPISGDHVGQNGYVEVVIQYNQKRNFSSIYGSDRIHVRARAVAEGGWRAANAGILLLDPSASGS